MPAKLSDTTNNPATGVERNQEEKRHRYLSPAELAKLTSALAELDDQQAANIVRLLSGRRWYSRSLQ